MCNKIDLWSGLCGVIAGDSRGLGPVTQRWSILNVPPIYWVQRGQFISFFATKIQISSYAEDCPGGIETKIIRSPFFFPLKWLRPNGMGLQGNRLRLYNWWGPSSIPQSHLPTQKQVWIPKFTLKLCHFKYLKFCPLFLDCILGSESTIYWPAFIMLLLLIDFKDLGLFIISFYLH